MLPNKKITRPINHSVSSSNVEAFLAYCAYDVRWNLAGSAPQVIQNTTRTFLKETKGENAKQNSEAPTGEAKKVR